MENDEEAINDERMDEVLKHFADLKGFEEGFGPFDLSWAIKRVSQLLRENAKMIYIYRKPREPKIIYHRDYMKYGIEYCCPTCGNTFSRFAKFDGSYLSNTDYCISCGQAIDWTLEDKKNRDIFDIAGEVCKQLTEQGYTSREEMFNMTLRVVQKVMDLRDS